MKICLLSDDIINLLKDCKKELVERGAYENSSVVTRINAVLRNVEFKTSIC